LEAKIGKVLLGRFTEFPASAAKLGRANEESGIKNVLRILELIDLPVKQFFEFAG